MNLSAAIEALIFASKGIKKEKLIEILNVTEEEVDNAVVEIQKRYADDFHGVELRNTEGLFRFYTKKKFSDLVGKFTHRVLGKLSESQLEIVTYIAVKGSSSRRQVDNMRGKEDILFTI